MGTRSGFHKCGADRRRMYDAIPAYPDSVSRKEIGKKIGQSATWVFHLTMGLLAEYPFMEDDEGRLSYISPEKREDFLRKVDAAGRIEG